ncbi:hypothetical protein AWRI1631_80290 [Saccharomyces cerevisiae AWRI1631]|nr:hypothetical protein AWRI1631_80290 [Saccharomyces cerevisiae AWRI1631]
MLTNLSRGVTWEVCWSCTCLYSSSSLGPVRKGGGFIEVFISSCRRSYSSWLKRGNSATMDAHVFGSSSSLLYCELLFVLCSRCPFMVCISQRRKSSLKLNTTLPMFALNLICLLRSILYSWKTFVRGILTFSFDVELVGLKFV